MGKKTREKYLIPTFDGSVPYTSFYICLPICKFTKNAILTLASLCPQISHSSRFMSKLRGCHERNFTIWLFRCSPPWPSFRMAVLWNCIKHPQFYTFSHVPLHRIPFNFPFAYLNPLDLSGSYHIYWSSSLPSSPQWPLPPLNCYNIYIQWPCTTPSYSA